MIDCEGSEQVVSIRRYMNDYLKREEVKKRRGAEVIRVGLGIL